MKHCRLASTAWIVSLLAWPIARPALAGCESFCDSPTACVFDGRTITAVGDATLAITPDCHLLVSGVGVTGLDGFSIMDYPDNTEFIYIHGPVQMQDLPVGASIETEFYHEGIPHPVATWTIVNEDGFVDRATLDQSLQGADTYTVTIMAGDEAVGTIEGLADGSVTNPLGPVCSWDCDGRPPDVVRFYTKSNCSAGPITVAETGDTFEGDRICISSNAAQLTTPPVDTIVRFTNTGPVEITKIELVLFDAVPAVSQWGMAAVTLALLALGSVVFARRRAGAQLKQAGGSRDEMPPAVRR